MQQLQNRDRPLLAQPIRLQVRQLQQGHVQAIRRQTQGHQPVHLLGYQERSQESHREQEGRENQENRKIKVKLINLQFDIFILFIVFWDFINCLLK